MKLTALLLAAALAGCATPAAVEAPRDRFFQGLAALCGKAFEGRIASPPVEADSAFAGKRLVMHVRSCTDDQIRMPFNVGEDRSRTWVVTRTAAGLRLKHDHRHADGSEDKLTQYGGDSVAAGTAVRQEFPADGFSKALFARENIPASATNVWAMEVDGRTFAYELRRPGRFFRVEFDLTHPVAPPPAPWGAR
ncbi:MAG TPA: hypothetical protein VD846_04475 [Allosphingosinicella sp.]|nr:hypothetical protein [Allosphingosinicella sp.]